MAEAETRLLEHYDQYHAGDDAMLANLDADATEVTGGSGTTFRRDPGTRSGFPREIEDAFTSEELLQLRTRGILRLAKEGEHAGGADAMSAAAMGQDRYVDMLRRKLADNQSQRLQRAIDFAKEEGGDPAMRWLAAWRETQLPRGEQPVQVAVDPRSLEAGTELEVNRIPVKVVEEGGEKILRDGDELPETPVEYAGTIQVDKGSVRAPDGQGGVRQSVVERLDAAADAALARARSKLGMMRSGLDPTIAADLALWAAGKVIAKGIRGFNNFKAALVAEFGPAIEAHARAIHRQAREIWKKERSADEVYEQAAQQQIQRAGTPAAAEGVQRRVRRLTGQAKPEQVRAELQALALKLRSEDRGMRAGFKLGEASERNRQATAAADRGTQIALARAIRGQMQASERAARVAGAAGVREGMQRVQDYKQQLAKLIKQHVEPASQGEMLGQLARVSTPGQLRLAVRQAMKIVARDQKRAAIRSLDETLKGFDPDKLAPALRDKFQEVAGDVATRNLSADRRQRLEAMVAFAEKNPDNTIPAATLEAARAALAKRRPEDMTAEEASALEKTVKNLLAQDRLLTKLRVAGKQRDARGLIDAALTTLGPKGSAESAGIVRRFFLYETPPRDEAGKPMADPRKNPLGTFIERRMNPDTLALALDNGKEEGLFGHLLRKGLREGAERAYRLFYEGQDHLAAATEAVGMKWGSQKLTDWANERVQFTLKEPTGIYTRDQATREVSQKLRTRVMTMTRAQRIDLAAQLTDYQTRDLLHEIKFKDRRYAGDAAFTLTESDKRAFLASLTQEERAIMEAMKGWLSGRFMTEQNKVFVRIEGYEKLDNPTYWPRRPDRSEFASEEPPSSVHQYGRKYLEELGQYQDRRSHRLPLLIDNAFEKFRDVTFKGSAFTGQAENLHAAWTVLGNPSVRKELVRAYGTQILHQVDEFLRAATMLRGDEGTLTGKVISGLSSNAARAILWKPKTAAKQLTGIINLMADLGPGPVARAMNKVIRDPKLLTTTWEQIRQHNGILRDRYEGAANRMISAQYADKRSALGRASLLEKLKENPRLLYKPVELAKLGHEHALDLMQAMDYVNAVIAWHAAEDMGLSGAEAGHRAALAISRTQNASSQIEYSGMQLEGRKDSTYRLLSMFTSQTEATYNLLARKMIEFQNSEKDAAAVGRLARDVSLAAGAAVAASYMIDELFSLGDDRPKPKTLKQQEQRERQSARYQIYKVVSDLSQIGGGVPMGTLTRAATSIYEQQERGAVWLLPAPFRGVVDTAAGASEVLKAGGDGVQRAGERSRAEKIWDGAEKTAKGLGILMGVPLAPEMVRATRAAADVAGVGPGPSR